MKSWLARKVRSLLGVHESLALQRLAADRWGDLQRTFAELQAAIPPAIRRQAEAADSAAQSMIRALESIDARLEALSAAAARPAAAPLDQLRANVSRDDLKYNGSAAEWYFFDELHRRAEDLAERSRTAAGLRLAA